MEEIRDKIDVVIVTYNSASIFEKNLLNISKKVRNIYIIDNNSKNKDEILKICSPIKNIHFVSNDVNLGLAAAQNIGIKYSLKEKSDFILFLDDDSEISERYLETLIKIYLEHSEKEKLAILSGEIIQNVGKELLKTKVRYKKEKRIIRRNLNENETRDDILFTISSGSLIKSELLKKIGYFEEKYFIDEIDTEFSLRVIEKGYKILTTSKVKLYQNYGVRTKIKFLGFNIYPTNHSPNRLYYKYRNFNWYRKKYENICPEHMKFIINQKILAALRVMVFEKEKILKIKYILKGLKDGK